MGKNSAKILVIDDEEDIREAVAGFLSEYQVVEAGNGMEGLELVKSEKPDLIITDIVMPEMQGIEFITRLNKIKKYIPVIVMSGNTVGKEYLKTAKLLGAVASFEKPFDFEELKICVDETLVELKNK